MQYDYDEYRCRIEELYLLLLVIYRPGLQDWLEIVMYMNIVININKHNNVHTRCEAHQTRYCNGNICSKVHGIYFVYKGHLLHDGSL